MPDDTTKPTELLTEFAELLWEYDVSELSWDEHREFIGQRFLASGAWEQICWLREELGDSEIRRIIEESKERDLSPQQLRFWQLNRRSS